MRRTSKVFEVQERAQGPLSPLRMYQISGPVGRISGHVLLSGSSSGQNIACCRIL